MSRMFTKILAAICCILFAGIINNTNQIYAAVNTNDSLALVNFYNNNGGTTWFVSDNWLTTPVGLWYGVELSADGTRVVGLDLQSNNVSGQFFVTGIDLPMLKKMQLSNNALNGSIPNFVLPVLEELDLSVNDFSGTIPNFNLPALKTLSLSSNVLSGSLPDFVLPALMILTADNNSLTGTIPALSGCPLLEVIDLSFNLLSGNIPNFALSSLNTLYLGSNSLSGTIPNFSGSQQLQYIVLNFNDLSGNIPVFNLPNLTELFLDFNQLSGNIPSLSGVPNLTILFLGSNQLSGTIPALPTSLLIIWINDNQFTFNGIETNATTLAGIDFTYAPQGEIATLQTSTYLYVDAGGTLTNNTYRWYELGASSPTVTNIGNNQFTPTMPGSYYCVITNSVATALTLISTPAPLNGCSLTIGSTSAACPGSATGTAAVVATGGVGPYTYNWSNGGQAAAITAVTAGIYTVTISDQVGCTASATVIVGNVSSSSFSLQTVGSSYCNAASNSLAYDFIIVGPSGNYTLSATSALETLNLNVTANIPFTVNLSPNTPEGMDLTFHASNSSGCTRDTVIVNEKCCKIWQEGTLVVVGESICPNPNPVIPGSCSFAYAITDKNDVVVTNYVAPDAGSCIKRSTVAGQLKNLNAPDGDYRLYPYLKCGSPPYAVGETIVCGNSLKFYYKKAQILLRLSVMTTGLKNLSLLPLQQPYNGSPWNYFGTEHVANSNSFSSNIVDWVLLELRDSSNVNTVISRRAALLLTNGSIVETDAGGNVSSLVGINFITFNNASRFFVVARHRNHLPILSQSRITVSDFSTYNFTDPANVSGGAAQLLSLGGGIYSMAPGDIDANGVCQVFDYNYYQSQILANITTNVYNDADCDLNGQVTVQDFNIWRANASRIGVPVVRY